MLIYHIIALLALAFSAVVGFRRGVARRVPVIIGLALGLVCARIFMIPFSEMLREVYPGRCGSVSENYFYTTLAAGFVFAAVYLVFTAVTYFIGKVLGRLPHSILDNIFGAVLGIFRMLIFLSFAYNLILAIHPDSMLRCVKSDDGNIVEGVLLVAPALTGSESAEEFAHEVQLQEARKISANQSARDVREDARDGIKC